MQAVATAIIEQLHDMGYRAGVTSEPVNDDMTRWVATATKGPHVHRSTGPTQYNAIVSLAESCGVDLEDG